MTRAIGCLFFLFGSLITPALGQAPTDDSLHRNGKIYIVVAVLVVIFLVIAGYLIYLDRRIHKLENQLPNGKNQ